MRARAGVELPARPVREVERRRLKPRRSRQASLASAASRSTSSRLVPLHPRGLLPLLQARVARRAVTVLTGARQTGKTTLVRDLLRRSDAPETVYFSLGDPDERLRLAADPVRRVDHGRRVVILDEIQKQPALLDAVKFLADRRDGHRFLLLGSSRILLLEKVRETLAGRASLLELWPLALAERVDTPIVPASGLDLVWRQGEVALERLSRASPPADEARRRALADEHRLWGGYPALESLPESDRKVWLQDFRRTYLERDLADLGRTSTSSRWRKTSSPPARRSSSRTPRWRGSWEWPSTRCGATSACWRFRTRCSCSPRWSPPRPPGS